jgi:hypothetical protein
MVRVLRRSRRPFGFLLAAAALVALLSFGGSRDARSDDDE